MRLLGTIGGLLLLLGCVVAYSSGKDDLAWLRIKHRAKILEAQNESERQAWIAQCLQERFPSWEDDRAVIKAGVKTCMFTAEEFYPKQNWRQVAKAQEKKQNE